MSLVEMAKANNSLPLVTDALVEELTRFGLIVEASTPQDRLITLTFTGISDEDLVRDLSRNAFENLGFSYEDPLFVMPDVESPGNVVHAFLDDGESLQRELETAGLVTASNEEDEYDQPSFEESEEESDEDESEPSNGLPDDLDEKEDEEVTTKAPSAEPNNEDDLSVLHTPEATKLVGRLYSYACGPENMSKYPRFWRELDQLMSKYRTMTGYNPDLDEEDSTGKEESNLEEAAMLALFTSMEVARGKGKKKFKKGRGGFLSSFMRASSGAMNDRLTRAWDDMDVEKLVDCLGDITTKVAEDLEEFANERDSK